MAYSEAIGDCYRNYVGWVWPDVNAIPVTAGVGVTYVFKSNVCAVRGCQNLFDGG